MSGRSALLSGGRAPVPSFPALPSRLSLREDVYGAVFDRTILPNLQLQLRSHPLSTAIFDRLFKIIHTLQADDPFRRQAGKALQTAN